MLLSKFHPSDKYINVPLQGQSYYILYKEQTFHTESLQALSLNKPGWAQNIEKY